MRITLLIPGTGNFFCGSCLRDDTLGRALRRLGHEVLMVPLYLPFQLETHEQTAPDRIFMGGINMYLQQKSALFRRMPRWLMNRLDSPRLLRWSAGHSDMTDASGLADMTLSMLRGEDGRQALELEKLVAWMAEQPRPDVICLNNLLLVGMARRIREAIHAPLVCALHGEQTFLDALPEPVRGRAWATVRERAGDVDRFVAVSRFYGDVIQDRVGLDPARVHVVHNGIELDGLVPDGAAAPPDPPVVGYLARMCPDKGLHTLVDAFHRIKQRPGLERVRLRAAGALLPGDRRYLAGLQRQVDRQRTGEDVEFLPNVTREEKIALLRSLSAFSVPATYGESFGLYLLEAMASGVPVVQPDHGAFPEILEATGGGVLCKPDDAVALADGLETLLRNPEGAQALGEQGRRSVQTHYTADRMAREVADVCMMAVQ